MPRLSVENILTLRERIYQITKPQKEGQKALERAKKMSDLRYAISYGIAGAIAGGFLVSYYSELPAPVAIVGLVAFSAAIVGIHGGPPISRLRENIEQAIIKHIPSPFPRSQ